MRLLLLAFMTIEVGLVATIAKARENSDSLSAVLKNNSGASKLQQEKAYEGYQDLLEALNADSENATIHLNLGLALESNKELDKALQEYLVAATLSKEDEIKFAGRFNSARVLAEQKKIDEALTQYQKALDVRPDSLEAKTNIELLMSMKSGGGGGDKNQNQKGGEGKDQKDQNENQKQDQKQGQKPDNPQYQSNKKPQPKPFKSEELSKQDVDKILNELKRQEEQIRGRMKEGKAPDSSPDKDW